MHFAFVYRLAFNIYQNEIAFETNLKTFKCTNQKWENQEGCKMIDEEKNIIKFKYFHEIVVCSGMLVKWIFISISYISMLCAIIRHHHTSHTINAVFSTLFLNLLFI